MLNFPVDIPHIHNFEKDNNVGEENNTVYPLYISKQPANISQEFDRYTIPTIRRVISAALLI